MARLPTPARARLEACLEAASTAAAADDRDTMWQHLEDAHVLSQPTASQHARVHLRMLQAGWKTKDRTEVRGQILRLIVAAPGTWSGHYPRGNTGRARVSATQPMPIRPDLEALLTER